MTVSQKSFFPGCFLALQRSFRRGGFRDMFHDFQRSFSIFNRWDPGFFCFSTHSSKNVTGRIFADKPARVARVDTRTMSIPTVMRPPRGSVTTADTARGDKVTVECAVQVPVKNHVESVPNRRSVPPFESPGEAARVARADPHGDSEKRPVVRGGSRGLSPLPPAYGSHPESRRSAYRRKSAPKKVVENRRTGGFPLRPCDWCARD